MGQPRIVRGKGVVKMSKTILEKINNKIDKLEKEKMDYLELGKTATVRKKEEEIEILNLALDGLNYKSVKNELYKCRKFIRDRGLMQQFEQTQEKE